MTKAINYMLFVLGLTVLLASAIGSELYERKVNFTFAKMAKGTPQMACWLYEPCWGKVAKITNFVLTAGDQGNPVENQTEAYLLYDEFHLYVIFVCADPVIQNIKAGSRMFDDSDILLDDRVEVFLDVNQDLKVLSS